MAHCIHLVVLIGFKMAALPWTTEEQNLAWERGKNKTPIITCGCEKQNMAGSRSERNIVNMI